MKMLKRLGLTIVVVGLLFALLVYKRPVWVYLQATHFGLFLSHIQSNYVMTPEGRVHYYEAEPRIPGGGIPLVLVHGLADRSETWAAMMKRLKRAGFHVYAPDLLGAGRSPQPSDSDYSVSTEEQFVVDFIQALGLQRPNVGGNSMGGWVVLKLAADHPDLVDRVIVYNSAGLRYQIGGGPNIFHPADGADLQRLGSLLEPNAKPLAQFIRRDALRVFQENQWVTDKAMTSMESGKDLLDDRLNGFSRPLLIVWGRDDQLLPFEEALKFHSLVPSSELDVLQGCGHLAPKTCTPRVAASTADFLKANPSPQGATRTLTSMH